MDVVICWLFGPGHAKREHLALHHRFVRFKTENARASSPAASRSGSPRPQSQSAPPLPPVSPPMRPQQTGENPGVDLVPAPLPPQSSTAVYDATTSPMDEDGHSASDLRTRADVYPAEQLAAARALPRKRQDNYGGATGNSPNVPTGPAQDAFTVPAPASLQLFSSWRDATWPLSSVLCGTWKVPPRNTALFILTRAPSSFANGAGTAGV